MECHYLHVKMFPHGNKPFSETGSAPETRVNTTDVPKVFPYCPLWGQNIWLQGSFLREFTARSRWTHLVSSGERTQGSHVGTDSSWDGVRHVEAHMTLSLLQINWGKTRNKMHTSAKDTGKRFVSAMSKLTSPFGLFHLRSSSHPKESIRPLSPVGNRWDKTLAVCSFCETCGYLPVFPSALDNIISIVSLK